MSVVINDQVYLTVPEATSFLKIKPNLMAHYIYRGEFGGIVCLNDRSHFERFISESGYEMDKDSIEKMFTRQRMSYLIPAKSVLEKHRARIEKISKREAKKLAKQSQN